VPCFLWCLCVQAVDIKRLNADGKQQHHQQRQPQAAGILTAPSEVQLLPGKAELDLDLEPSAESTGGSSGAVDKAGLSASAGGSKETEAGAGGGAEDGSLERVGEVPVRPMEVAAPADSQPAPEEEEADAKQPPAAGAAGAAAHGTGLLGTLRATLTDLCQLARHRVCIAIILALTCWNGFLGAYGERGMTCSCIDGCTAAAGLAPPALPAPTLPCALRPAVTLPAPPCPALLLLARYQGAKRLPDPASSCPGRSSVLLLLLPPAGYYGPKALHELFDISADDADFLFGAVLAGAGAGALLGCMQGLAMGAM